MTEIKDLLGKTLSEVKRVADDELIFVCDNGVQYKMYHRSDCCESVSIDDIVGDLEDLIGSPITMAEEVSNPEHEQRWLAQQKYAPESYTWTFYKLATIKGYVDIKWLGESNGYYSESVDFEKIK